MTTPADERKALVDAITALCLSDTREAQDTSRHYRNTLRELDLSASGRTAWALADAVYFSQELDGGPDWDGEVTTGELAALFDLHRAVEKHLKVQLFRHATQSHRASQRAIAERCGTNQSLIQRWITNGRELYNRYGKSNAADGEPGEDGGA